MIILLHNNLAMLMEKNVKVTMMINNSESRNKYTYKGNLVNLILPRT